MRRALACRLTSHFLASTSAATATLQQQPSSVVACGLRAGRWGDAAPALSAARWFSSPSLDVAKEVDAVNELFTAARDEIEYAKEEAETVYFNESVQEAKKAVDACMSRWEALLAGLPEGERARVVRSMGLKIAQLQAEYDVVSKLHLED